MCIPYSQIFIEVKKEAAYIFLEKAVPMGYITLIAESADWVESELIQYTNIRLRPTFIRFFYSFDTGYGLFSNNAIDYTIILTGVV